MIISKEKELIGSTYSISHYEEYKKTGDKNIFEEVIDQLMIDLLNPELQNRIKNLPLKDKRLSILAFLDKDRNLFLKIKALLNKDINKIDHIKDVITMLRTYVKVGEVEKKKFGEVMTPLELVKEMLATLPEEVWTNPNLKWLDPANGTGPYPMWVIFRLMKGLEKWEPNEEKRYKHIVENMIYVCELQPKNMFLYMCAVDPWDMYKLNIYTGSFLESGFDKHMKEVWTIDRIDIVMGNPPYNTGTSGGNGNRDLWDKFVIKSFDILNKDAYLLFIHPPKWRKPESSLYKIFSENNLIYLEIHSDADGYKLFGATTRYDWYLLQKANYSGKTLVIDELSKKIEINIKDWKWIPNYNFDLISKIISKNGENLSVIYSSSIYEPRKRYISSNKTEFPCIYGMYQNLTCSYYYSDSNRGHFGISKVILGIGRHLYPLIDMEGKYGMTQNAFGIFVESEQDARNIKSAIETKEFKEILKSTKWSNFQVDYKMFKSIKKDFWREFI